MDYSYPEEIPYYVGPLQAAYAEEAELNTSVEDSQNVFPTIFTSPYDEFLEPLMPSPHDLSDLPLTGPDGLPRDDSDGQLPPQSSSDEKEPGAKSRRKEQNRAAQRAFRARKERHVKDLEKKLSEIESSATTLASDNQRLKLALQRLMTENEILRSSSGRPARMGKKPAQGPRKDGKALGEKTASDVLSMSDAWDFLIEHALVKEGFVDITDASYRLRRAAKPGPHGPVFHKGEAQAAIQGSRKGGGDVLA